MIYIVCDNIVIVCFNDVRFDIMEYFAKTIQNTPTGCTHILREVSTREVSTSARA